MRLAYLRKRPLETAFICFLFAVGLAGLPYAALGGLFFTGKAAQFCGLALVRMLSAAFLFCMLRWLGLEEGLSFGGRRAALPLLFALLIAVNNLPVIALVRGDVFLTAGGGEIFLFAVSCAAVALFEELAFRGAVFPLLLQEYGTDRRGRTLAVVGASLFFGAAHLTNLLAGGGAAQTFLQAGYSFLIGAMLAVCMLEGAGVLLCAAVHATYNFCGLLVSELGNWSFSAVWNPPTVGITVLLGAAAIAYFTVRLLRSCGCAERLSRPAPAVRLRYGIRRS